MHADELDIDVHLVHRLVASQFPHWANLPLAPVPSAGTDNAIYRFGGELVARLPRSPSRVAPLVNERTWLPRLGSLPLAVPVIVAEGAPGEGYPWTWSVYRWLEGDNPTPERVDLERAAIDLAEFVRALQRLDPTGGPPPGEHNFGRGEPLSRRDDATRRAIASPPRRARRRRRDRGVGRGAAGAAVVRASPLDPRRPLGREPSRSRGAARGGDRLRMRRSR
jgi:aminoglycoside phosphotransferase (APT) family kinase protein